MAETTSNYRARSERPKRFTPIILGIAQSLHVNDEGLTNPVVTHAAENQRTNRIIGLICPFLPPRESPKCPPIRKMLVGAVGIEPT